MTGRSGPGAHVSATTAVVRHTAVSRTTGGGPRVDRASTRTDRAVVRRAAAGVMLLAALVGLSACHSSRAPMMQPVVDVPSVDG